MFIVQKKIFLLLLPLLLLCGCGGGIKLEHCGSEGRISYNDQLTVMDGMTSDTTNLLGNYLLADMLNNDPEHFIDTLEDLLAGDRVQEVRIALAETGLILGRKFSCEPDKAVRYHLSVLLHAQEFLESVINNPGADLFDPDIPVAIKAYNLALTELFSYLRARKLHSANGFELTAAGGQLIRFSSPGYNLPVKSEHITAFHLCSDYRTRNLTHNNRRFGIGVQLICELAENAIPETVFAEAQVIPATLVIRFAESDSKRKVFSAKFHYLDSRTMDEVPVKNFTLPLAQDFSTPLAFMIRKPPAINFIQRALLTESNAAYEGLYHLEPHNDDRIPVVFVHGLMSDTRTWMQMLNTLLSDPLLRKHYRFMGFTYSSGNPVLYSALHLRRALQKEREKLIRDKRDLKNFDRMVLIGHSMGGLLTRLQISNSDEKSLTAFFGRDIYQKIMKYDRQNMSDLLIFSPNKSIKRVVFIAVPHRGAALADSALGKIAASMVKLPRKIIDFNRDLFNFLVDKNGAHLLKKMEIFTGIDNLSPRNSALGLINKTPMAPIPKHSIIGNISGGDIPGGSDGVVPYQSSHLNDVQSEKVVKSGHSVQQNPLAIQEIRRILREHLASFPDTASELEK